MFLFIFDNIGTGELILIGIVALIFLGPRKMPEYARKIGKMMNDFRSTTNEFKQTWQREVDFSEEAKAFRIDHDPVPPTRVNSILDTPKNTGMTAPAITEVDPAKFKEKAAVETTGHPESKAETFTVADFVPVATEEELHDKRNWL
jgi:sec-independent protein translocase protein TatB